MTNFQISLLQESLMITLRDKYAMPNDWKGWREKYERIQETYDLLETMRQEEELNFNHE